MRQRTPVNITIYSGGVALVHDRRRISRNLPIYSFGRMVSDDFTESVEHMMRMGALTEFAAGLWIADGPPVRNFGIALPTRMIVVKLADGTLWINSPVDAAHDDMDRVAHLGPVKHLVAPTSLHVWRLHSWVRAFPEAQVWTPQTMGGTPPAAWQPDLDQMVFRGNRLLNEMEFFHPVSRTLIFSDFIQNYPPRAGAPLFNIFMNMFGVLGGGVPADIRLSFRNKAIARRSLEKLLAWDFDKVILAHGDCVEHDAKAFVRRAFHWLDASA